jgi:hypothetical protein
MTVMRDLFRLDRAPFARRACAIGFFACSAVLSCAPFTEDTRANAREVADRTRQELTISEPDPDINNQFGDSLAADGQTIIVGDHSAYAPDISGNLQGRGEVNVYTRSGNDWQHLQVLKPPGPKSSEIHFGDRVVLNGNNLLVSADRDGISGTNFPFEEGSVYLFNRPGPGQQFVQVAQLTAPAPVQGGRWGFFLATNGNFIAVATSLEAGAAKNTVDVFSLQGTTVSYRYTITADLPGSPPVFDLAMTQAGVVVILVGSEVRGYHLQQNQATQIADTNQLSTVYQQVKASGNTIALLDRDGGGQITLANADTARVSAIRTIDISAPDGNQLRSIDFLPGQHILVSESDDVRPRILKFVPSGDTYAFSGSIYPALGSRISQNGFGNALTSTSSFVAVSDVGVSSGRVHVLGVETNGRLDEAVFDQQQLLARDACGTQCAGENFLATNFGRAVAISGDVAAVTATEQVIPPPRDPSVHIYTRGTSSWQHAARFGLGGKRARGVAVNSGRVFIGQGTPGDPSVGFTDGSVRVYERNAQQVWTLADTLVADDDGSLVSTFLGDEIAVDGDIAAVGAYLFVYIFQRNSDGSWSQIQQLPVDPSMQSPQAFAHAVALSPDHLLIGARWDSQVIERQGSAFVYRRSDWTLEQKLGPVVTGANRIEFGQRVAIDGNTIMIGAPNPSTTLVGTGGFVEVYERIGSGATPWERVASLRPKHGLDYRFGTSVSVVGNLALMGALQDPLTETQGGAAYLFTRVNGGWSEDRAHILLPRDHGRGGSPGFGFDVQLTGSRAIVGAPSTDVDGFFNAGAAYIFEGIVDADADGVLEAQDCDDNDGLGLRCALTSGNMSFEQIPDQAWTAVTGSFTFDSTLHTDGLTSLRLGPGPVRLRGPVLQTTDLVEVGTTLALDIYRLTATADAVTLFMSAPAFGIYESVIGAIDLTGFPVGQWVTVSAAIPAQLRDIMLTQDTGVTFHIFSNVGGVLVDRLHFSGQFASRDASPAPSSTLSASISVTSSSDTGYCAALRLNNSASSATAGWRVVLDSNGTTLSSSWNAAFSGTSGTITIASNQTWNSSVPAGATNYDPSVGFCANRNAGSSALPSVVSATAL